MESGRATEDQILMLAYNRDVAKELSERTKASNINVKAQTFHGFGNSVIKEQGERTGVAFGNDGEVAMFLAHQLENALDAESKLELLQFFAEEMVPKRQYEEFESLNEYAAYVRATIPRTLMDEQVKSLVGRLTCDCGHIIFGGSICTGRLITKKRNRSNLYEHYEQRA